MPSSFRPMMSAEQKAEMEKRKAKQKERMDECAIEPCETDYYWPQTIQFKKEQLPEITSWEVGKHYKITVKVKMVAYEDVTRQSDGSSKKEKKEGRFEIIAVKSESKFSTDQQGMAKKLGVKI